MAVTRRAGRRWVPLLLGAGMVGAVAEAVLSSGVGAVDAQNCAYAGCTQNGTTAPFPWWLVALGVVLVLAALIALLLIMRRRRGPSSAGPEPWQPPAGAGGPSPETGPQTAGVAAPAASYLETPEDVGRAPPEVAGGAAAGAAAGAAGEPDIDSLMAELDKISGEILKKAPKTQGGSEGSGDDTGGGSSGS